MRHADHDLVRPVFRSELDRFVEHRHHDVEPFDRELLLTEERAAQILLEGLHARELCEQILLLVCRERHTVLAGLDCLPQPHALLVIGDVLDLVGDRSGIGLGQARQRVGEGLAWDVETEDGCGHERL